MPGSGTTGRKSPACASCGAPSTQNLEHATAHRNKSSAFGGLTVGHEDHPIFPIEILDAHAVEFSLVSHSRIAHQDDDVTEKFTRSLAPLASRGARYEFPFRFIVKPKVSPMLLHHFDFRSVAD